MHISKRFLPLALALAAISSPCVSRASVYGDDLARCLVENTTEGDKVDLAQWIFTVMSVHPSAAALANVSEADRTAVAKKVGKVFDKLLTQACKDQASKAMKYEGIETLKGSFKTLGEIAMNTILSNPRVSEESGNFVKYVDQAQMQALFASPSGGG